MYFLHKWIQSTNQFVLMYFKLIGMLFWLLYWTNNTRMSRMCIELQNMLLLF